MALELVRSSFRRSFCPPALEVECEWQYDNGKILRTLSLADPDTLANIDWWVGLHAKIGLRAYRIKTGEVVVVTDDTHKT